MKLDSQSVITAQDARSTGGNPSTAQTGSRTTRTARAHNARTGMGGLKDKDLGAEFIAKRMEREEAERLYQMSWAAARMIDIPVDDMLIRGRHWIGDDQGAIDAMEEAERELKAMTALGNAMKAGRIFGSGLLIVCTDSDDFDKPINPTEIKEGQLRNLWVVDRWACSVQTWQTRPNEHNYGQPYQYRVNGRIFGSPAPEQQVGYAGLASLGSGSSASNLTVHSGRVLRFDGKRSPLTEGWTTGPWEREWGVSVLTSAVDEIMRDVTIHAGVGHLVNEASVWVQKVHDFKEAMKGRADPSSPTAEEIAVETSLLRSIYRTMFIDVEDEVERVGVNFGGLPQLMNQQSHRLAAIAGIPVTRFLGTSATGLNATGEGDARDYRLHVAAMQQRDLDPVLRSGFDMMIARHAGLQEPPEYEWVPLGEMTELEQGQVLEHQTNAVNTTYASGLVDEDEAREQLEKNEFWNNLGPWTPSQQQENEEVIRQQELEDENARRAASQTTPA